MNSFMIDTNACKSGQQQCCGEIWHVFHPRRRRHENNCLVLMTRSQDAIRDYLYSMLMPHLLFVEKLTHFPCKWRQSSKRSKIVKIQHLFKEFSKTVTLLLESKQYFHSFYVLLHHFFVRSLPVLMSFKAFFVVEVNTIIGKKTMKRDTSKSFASLAPLLWECNTKSFWHLLHLTFNNSPLLFLFRVTVVKRNMVWHNSSCSSGKAATAKTKIAGLIHCVVLLLSDTCIGLLHTIPYLNKSLTSY